MVFLNIAIDGNLEDIRKGLENKGYQIVNLEGDESIDAIVYINNGHEGSNLQQETSSPTIFTGENIHTKNGAFMINARDKSIDEIDQLLKQRSYSPLFRDFY